MDMNASLSHLRTWTKSSRSTRRHTCSELLGYKGLESRRGGCAQAHEIVTAYMEGPDMHTYVR